MVDNYLEMANNAYGASNNVEAESYCNKIIEIDPTNYKAWFLKGKAAGWQSTLQNSRLSESVAAFAKAIVNAPEEEKEEIIEEAKDQVKNLSIAMINLRGNRFAKWPDEEETAGFTSDITSIFSIVLQFIKQAGVIIPIAELTAPIATTINQSVVKAFNDVIWPDYNGDPNDSDDRANKYEWQKFIKRIGHCTTLVEKAINLCDEDDESDIQRYENLIYLHEKAIDSCSWDYTFSSYSSSKIWSKEWSLTDEAKAVRRKLIAGYRAKIAEIKSAAERKAEEERKQRIKAYWDNHKQEKDALENEAKSLESQKKQYTDEIAQLQKQKESVPALAQLIQVQKNIEKMEEEKKALGLFKGKEKKSIQEKIDVQEADKNRLKQQVASQQQEIEQKITPVRTKLNAAIARLKAIDQELTKDRK
jgi:hypothetical protein